ncbi:MAG: glycosyltransferase family 2 protein, partial [Spirochaetes bacterium]|nr:glycosyltransferase family 2 protein [Spirochaetota bacterium]
DFELIVVDDGSTDDTHRIEAGYKNALKYVYQENSGVSKARNTGILMANSPHIAFLDSDDIWLPEKLEEHRNYIINNPRILIHQTDEIWIRNGRRVNPGKRHASKSGGIFIGSLDLCLISPSAVALNRELFDRNGLFDENLPVCEDYDLWLRITSEETAGLIDKKLIIKHGGHESQLSKTYPAMDIYRIYSIIKLLKNKKDLKKEYREAAVSAAKNKCGILINGAAKRGNGELAGCLANIIKDLEENNYSSTDFESLLRVPRVH